MKDLVLLVADGSMKCALRGALSHPRRMGIRPVEFDFLVHPRRDSGVREDGPALISTQRKCSRHALLVMDLEGAGASVDDALELEAELDDRLRALWGTRAKAIVIEPELEAWVWGSDNAIQPAIGWNRTETVREWLAAHHFPAGPGGKPVRPKEAFEAVLRVSRQPRSSSLYERIAGSISLSRCVDPAFVRLRDQLGTWFPA